MPGVKLFSRRASSRRPITRSVVDSVIAEDHDACTTRATSREAPLVLKQYRDKGGEGLFLGGDGDKGTNFLKEGGEDAEGAIVTCPCLDPNTIGSAEAEKFVSDYQEEYGRAARTFTRPSVGYNAHLHRRDQGRWRQRDTCVGS